MPQKRALPDRRIVVIGAGMVGVCTALALQRRGLQVTLIDRKSPGQETSFGNAGMLARSSLIPLNSPALFPALPRLALNQSATLRYDPMYVMRNLPWMMQFLLSARRPTFLKTAKALNSLITLSIEGHLSLLHDTQQTHHLSDKGWIFLYRDQAGFDAALGRRDVMRQHDVPFDVLNQNALRDLEPDLNPIFPKALWIRGSYAINDPGAIVAGYARAFAAAGGVIVQGDVRGMIDGDDVVTLKMADMSDLTFDDVVLCAGPWAKALLERAGYRVRMAFERGYHRQFTGIQNGSNLPVLRRPVCDTSGGYVLSPMQAGLRLTSGVELAGCDAPANTRQMVQVERAARQAIQLGERTDDATWLGSRPTFPDSRPAIGYAPGSHRVALGIGHQHIGFATGPGTGQMLADIMTGQPCAIDPVPFRTDRFIRRA